MRLVSQDWAFREMPVDNTVRDKSENRFFFFYTVRISPFYLSCLAYVNSLAQLRIDENIYINETNHPIFLCSLAQEEHLIFQNYLTE